MKSLLAILLCAVFAFSAIPPYLADPGPYPGSMIHRSKVVKASYVSYPNPTRYAATIIIQDTIYLGNKNWQYDCMEHYVGRCVTPNYYGPPALCTLSQVAFTLGGLSKKGRSQLSRVMGVGVTDSFGTIRTYTTATTMIVSTDTLTWASQYDLEIVVIGTKRFLSVPIGFEVSLHCVYDSSASGNGIACGKGYNSTGLFRIIIMKAFAQDTVLIQIPSISVERPAPSSLIQNSMKRKGTYDVLGRRIQSMNPASAIYLEGKKRIVIH